MLERLESGRAGNPVQLLAREASMKQVEAAALLASLDGAGYEALIAQSRGTRPSAPRRRVLDLLRERRQVGPGPIPAHLLIGPGHAVDRRWLRPIPAQTESPVELRTPSAYVPPGGNLRPKLLARLQSDGGSAASLVSDPRRMSPSGADAAREAFVAFSDYVQACVARGIEVGPELKAAWCAELVERASAHLTGQGIVHEIVLTDSGQFRLEITPGSDHPLSRIARGLGRNCRGLGLYYLPEILLKTGFSAAFLPSHNVILLGDRDLLETKSSVLLHHEIRHAVRRHRLRSKAPSEHYGQLDGSRGRLLKTITNTYERFQSVDEMDAYALSFREGFLRLRRALAVGPVDLETSLPGMVNVIQNGLEVSLRNISAAKLALHQLQGDQQLEFETRDGLTWAVAHTGVGRAPLELPLVASSGVNDPENRSLLLGQLHRLLEAAKEHLAGFRFAQKFWDRMSGTSDLAERSLLAEAARDPVLGRAGRLSVSKEPVSLDALIDAFNTQVEALWQEATRGERVQNSGLKPRV